MNIDELALFIKNERRSQKITQEELAGLSNTGKRFISDFENGKESIQLNKVIDVLDALGFKLDIIRKWNQND